MKDWTVAYRRLYKFIGDYSGCQFIKTVQQIALDLLDYNDYIEKRHNEKTLENQVSFLVKFQKDKGVSTEISNIFLRLIEIFVKYQNRYVKRHDKVKHSEIEFVFILTNTFNSFLLSY